ncbi:MAG: TrkH family potassium uptake protein [Firmicutes bacterium]|nr:TrkH family potassium uptake protein [Bacillota bacterium]
MRVGPVANIMATLLIFLGVLMFIPLIFSFFYGEDPGPLLWSGVITILFGLTLRFFTPPAKDLNSREGFAVAAAGWLLAAAFGSLPFLFAGTAPTPVDAFFESMSGFTTTGATILADIEAQAKGILFWRSFTHYLGGMGIIVLSLAILPHLASGGLQLFRAEVPGPTAERFLPRVADTARTLWFVYGGLSLLQTLLLLLGGMSLFDALTHTFATMGTGGYSTRNLSVGAFASLYIEVVILLFMFLAGANFSLHYRALTGKPRALWGNAEFRFYTLGLVVATLLITINLWRSHYGSILTSLRHGGFQVVSIATTTSFVTADISRWPPFSQGLLLFLEFVGGCAGSTAGALKQIRVLVLFKYGYREIRRLLHPRAVIPLRLGNKVLPERVIAGIVGFLFLYIGIFLLGSLVLMWFGVELPLALTAVATSLGNAGPGLHIMGPYENFLAFSPGVKLFLSLLMLLGRLEIFTLLVLLLPDYLRGVRFSSK